MRTETPFRALLLTVVYASLVALTMTFHEVWRDETQAWMLSRDSSSLSQLFFNRRYEGHPLLWHFLLFLLSRATGSAAAMQALQLGICSASVYLIARFAPLSWTDKALLTGGYFFLFEYGVMSRSYSLAVLLLVVFAVQAGRAGAWVALALLAHVSLHALILAGALALWLLSGKGRSASGLLLFTLSCLLSIYWTLPPQDQGIYSGWFLQFSLPRLCRAGCLIWQAFVPIPLIQIGCFDTNILSEVDSRYVYTLSLFILGVTALALRNRSTRALYLGSVLLLQVFAYVKFIGYNRHAGHYFLIWLVCLWLDAPRGCGPRRTLGLRLLLLLHLVVGLGMVATDLRYPFSASYRVARALDQERRPLAGMPGSIVAPVGYWLNRPIFSAEANRWETFTPWDSQRATDTPPDLLLRLKQLGPEVVLVANRPFFLKNVPNVTFQPIGEFPHGMVPDEGYYLYLLTFPPAQRF